MSKVDKAVAWDEIAKKNAEIDRLRTLAKDLSDALLKIRPLGGSEMFIRRCEAYYADPDYCGRLIDEMRASLDGEIRTRIRLERSLSSTDGKGAA
jgi:hypothetical protein